ncbi:MAG: hypothetical protein ACI3XI_09320 [Eubacteriales bacterium]
MEKSEADNKILGQFAPRTPLALILALASALGSLSLLLSDVPIFAGIAVAVMLALVFMTVRGGVRFIVIIPALIFMVLTGEVALPAIYLGFVFTFASSLYLTAGRRWFVPLLSGAAAYAVAFLLFDGYAALLVLVPVLLGMIASMALQNYGLAPTVGTLTLLGSVGAVLALLVGGVDITAAADALRDYITGVYLGVSNELLVIDEKTAELLATVVVNMLPGIMIAAASVMIWAGCKLAIAFLEGSHVSDIPESAKRIELAPVSGIVYVLAFMLSSAFAIEGGDYEMAGAVTDNLLIILAPAFLAFGLRTSRDRLERKLSRFEVYPTGTPRRVANGVAAVTCLLVPGISPVIYLVLGVIGSFSPIFDAIKRKLRDMSDNNGD